LPTPASQRKRYRVVIAAAALALLAAAPSVRADPPEDDECPGKQTLVTIEKKTCPPTPRRPAIVVERKCCLKNNGKIHCNHFPHCPSHSPS